MTVQDGVRAVGTSGSQSIHSSLFPALPVCGVILCGMRWRCRDEEHEIHLVQEIALKERLVQRIGSFGINRFKDWFKEICSFGFQDIWSVG